MTAKWLGHPEPWKLADAPADWIAAAQTAMAAENGAQIEIQKRDARRAKMSRRRGA